MSFAVRFDFMRILIVGASGLVGAHVHAESIARGHEVVGTYRSHPVPGLVPLDLADEAATRVLVETMSPDWVVHAAGWTWVDGCERDPARAMRENCEQPAMLARICREAGGRFAYFSTTYVFDGVAGPYAETDIPSPINTYARSKLAGEKAVRAESAGHSLIPRIICVWGKERQQKNFAYQVAKAVHDGKPMRIPSDQEGNPTWAGDIAAWLVDLMQAGEIGVWNLVGDSPRCLRGEWLTAITSGLAALGQDWHTAVQNFTYEAVPTAIMAQPALRPLRGGGLADKIQARFPRVVCSPREVSLLF